MIEKVQVTISAPGFEKTFSVRKGIGFQALCVKHETPIEFDCREADCGICAVQVLSGMENLEKMRPLEAGFLKAMRADPNERLACQCRIFGDVRVCVDI